MTHRLTFTIRAVLVVGGLSLVILFAALLTRRSDAAESLRIFDWNDPAGLSNTADWPVDGTGIIQHDSVDFVPVALDVAPSRADSRPIAILATPPLGTTDISILAYPITETTDPGVIAYQLASVRYHLNGQVLYIGTLQPANLGLTRPLNIGRRHGDIGNGRVVYTSSKVVREGPNLQTRRTFNVVSFVENGLVVTISSEMPSATLIALAEVVTFNAR